MFFLVGSVLREKAWRQAKKPSHVHASLTHFLDVIDSTSADMQCFSLCWSTKAIDDNCHQSPPATMTKQYWIVSRLTQEKVNLIISWPKLTNHFGTSFIAMLDLFTDLKTVFLSVNKIEIDFSLFRMIRRVTISMFVAFGVLLTAKNYCKLAFSDFVCKKWFSLFSRNADWVHDRE